MQVCPKHEFKYYIFALKHIFSIHVLVLGCYVVMNQAVNPNSMLVTVVVLLLDPFLKSARCPRIKSLFREQILRSDLGFTYYLDCLNCFNRTAWNTWPLSIAAFYEFNESHTLEILTMVLACLYKQPEQIRAKC